MCICKGGVDRGTRRIYFLCVVSVLVCVGVRRERDMGAEGVSPREVRWVEVRPFVRFRPAPHWSARDAFRKTHG